MGYLVSDRPTEFTGIGPLPGWLILRRTNGERLLARSLLRSSAFLIGHLLFFLLLLPPPLHRLFSLLTDGKFPSRFLPWFPLFPTAVNLFGHACGRRLSPSRLSQFLDNARKRRRLSREQFVQWLDVVSLSEKRVKDLAGFTLPATCRTRVVSSSD